MVAVRAHPTCEVPDGPASCGGLLRCGVGRRGGGRGVAAAPHGDVKPGRRRLVAALAVQEVSGQLGVSARPATGERAAAVDEVSAARRQVACVPMPVKTPAPETLVPRLSSAFHSRSSAARCSYIPATNTSRGSGRPAAARGCRSRRGRAARRCRSRSVRGSSARAARRDCPAYGQRGRRGVPVDRQRDDETVAHRRPEQSVAERRFRCSEPSRPARCWGAASAGAGPRCAGPRCPSAPGTGAVR